MRCPFPGMDPYLERPALWSDFHDRLITYICEQLQPQLLPRYAALTQDRLYVVEHLRPIWPDVAVVETGQGGTAVAVANTPDRPLVIKLEEVRQPMLQIVEPAAGNRIVSGIEVLSPDNKQPGAGRASYLQKRDELWSAGANLVELDLLRSGKRIVPAHCGELAAQMTGLYHVLVSRRSPPQLELYCVPLEQRLPRVSIPLLPADEDVVLDVQAAFDRCWQAGPYPTLLGYDEPPPGRLARKQVAWCQSRLQAAFPPRKSVPRSPRRRKQ